MASIPPLATLLKQIMVQSLAELGFGLRTPRQGVWVFATSPAPGFEQYVTIYRDRYMPKNVHCDYGTTDVPHVASAEWLVSKKLSCGWEYADEESLRALLNELLRITLEHGIPAIERLGGPFLKPSEVESRRLFTAPQALAAAFGDQYGLQMGDPKSLATVEDIIRTHKHQTGAPDWDLLIGAASFLGELVRLNLGAQWVWEEYQKAACLSVKIGYFSPLQKVGEFWTKETSAYLTSYYQYFADRR